jgi:predicted Fe-S protein YdhL (DUF1289 family)
VAIADLKSPNDHFSLCDSLGCGRSAETISEVLALSNDCEEQVWQKFYAASGRISEKLNESDFL